MTSLAAGAAGQVRAATCRHHEVMFFSQHPLVKCWSRTNAPFAVNGNRGPTDGPRWDIAIRGPLVVSAVHGVDHVRDRRVKQADAGTGGLAVAVSEAIGCGRVLITRSVPLMGDANWEVSHPLKAELERSGHIGPETVFIDLHGMKEGNGADVIIGCGDESQESVALGRRVARHLNAAKVVTEPNGAPIGFGGAGPGTMTSFAQRLGAAAIQIEIARPYRAAAAPYRNKLRLITGLVAALQEERDRAETATSTRR